MCALAHPRTHILALATTSISKHIYTHMHTTHRANGLIAMIITHAHNTRMHTRIHEYVPLGGVWANGMVIIHLRAQQLERGLA